MDVENRCCPSGIVLMQSIDQANVAVADEHDPTIDDNINGDTKCMHQADQSGDHNPFDGNFFRRTYHNRRYFNNYFQRKSRSFKVYELDGQYKFNLKNSYMMYINSFQCPNCILTNLAQTYRYKGIPWCKRNIDYRFDFKDVYHGLHAELNDFYNFMKPLTEDDTLRKATFYCISHSIKRTRNFSIDGVKYYGSYSSNTYLPVSDIDLVVYCNPNEDVVQLLISIAHQLFFDGIIDNSCHIIPHSRIPLLKFYDSLTGLPINITINTPFVMERSRFIRENIKPNTYLIKILYFLKFYLLHKGSNQVFHGGIGSYSLSLMVIRYFQENATKDLIQKYEKSCEKSVLGYLLVGFLERYSDLNFIRNHNISVRNGGEYIESHKEENTCTGKKQSVLHIEDHLEPWKNVCSGSYNSDLILSDFGYLLNKLIRPVEGRRSKLDRSILARAVVVVDSFVDYRNILMEIFRVWFDPIFKKYGTRSRVSNDIFGEFIQKRNIYGKRPISFTYKPLEDNAIEMNLAVPPNQGKESNSRDVSPDLNSSDFYSSQSAASSPSTNEGCDYNSSCSTNNEVNFTKRYQQTMAVNCYNSPNKVKGQNHSGDNGSNPHYNRNRNTFGNERYGVQQYPDKADNRHMEEHYELNTVNSSRHDADQWHDHNRNRKGNTFNRSPKRFRYPKRNNDNRARNGRQLAQIYPNPDQYYNGQSSEHICENTDTVVTKESNCESKATEIKKILKINESNS